MKVIEMGNLGLADGMTGVLIEATKGELQQMSNLLYEDVKIVSVGGGKDGKRKKSKEELESDRYFERQVERYSQVTYELAKDAGKTYSNKDVLKILDFVLDGIGNLPGVVRKANATKEQQADDNKESVS